MAMKQLRFSGQYIYKCSSPFSIQNPWLLYNIYGKPVARGRIEVFDPKVFSPQLVSFILGMGSAQHL